MTSRPDIERFLRVDHAGERAAQQIYKGQLVVLRNHSSGEEIQHMMEQEIEHLETFEALLNERQVRPSSWTLFGVPPALHWALSPQAWDQRQQWPAPSR